MRRTAFPHRPSTVREFRILSDHVVLHKSQGDLRHQVIDRGPRRDVHRARPEKTDVWTFALQFVRTKEPAKFSLAVIRESFLDRGLQTRAVPIS